MEPSKSKLFVDQKLLKELVRDGISIQDCFQPEALLKKTGKGYFKSNIVEELKAVKRIKKGK